MTPKREIDPAGNQPANALLICCSESPLLSAFVYSLEPRCILQNLGGTLPEKPPTISAAKSGGDSAWGTVAYALDQLALRHIVICGHSRCCVPPMWLRGKWGTVIKDMEPDSAMIRQLSDANRASQPWLTEQMTRLDRFLAHSRHRADTTTHALWFDEDRREILMMSEASRRFVFVNDAEIQQFLLLLDLTQERAQEVLKRFRQI